MNTSIEIQNKYIMYMPYSTYSIDISSTSINPSTNQYDATVNTYPLTRIFQGGFTVDNSSHLITEFHNSATPGINLLQSLTGPPRYNDNDTTGFFYYPSSYAIDNIYGSLQNISYPDITNTNGIGFNTNISQYNSNSHFYNLTDNKGNGSGDYLMVDGVNLYDPYVYATITKLTGSGPIPITTTIVYCSTNNSANTVYSSQSSQGGSYTILNYNDTNFHPSISIPPGKIFDVWKIFQVDSLIGNNTVYHANDTFHVGDQISAIYIVTYYVYPIFVNVLPPLPSLPYIAPNPYIQLGNSVSIPFSPNIPSVPRMNITLFSNNSLVLYKTHSLPTSGAGSVRNSRSVGRRT